MRTKRGFSMTELLIAMIIVAIIAAFGIAISGKLQNRAMVTEAVEMLGFIRSIQRNYYSEHGRYLGGAGTFVNVTTVSAISPGDLDGNYFSEECYAVADQAVVFGKTGAIGLCTLSNAPGSNTAERAADAYRVFGDQAPAALVIYADGEIRSGDSAGQPLVGVGY